MNILGIHCSTKFEEENQIGTACHDVAAVLLRDGELVAAFEEERLNRLKHSSSFPVHAIQRCLEYGMLSLKDVDVIAVNREESLFDYLSARDWLTNSAARACKGRDVLADCFKRSFDVDIADKLFFCPHHLAHARSASVPSGFERCLVFIADGDGDNLSGMVLVNEAQDLKILRQFPIQKSLGNLYQLVIGLIGYNRFDEYKAMGLAPYGDPKRFAEAFTSCYDLLPNGDYHIATPPYWIAEMQRSGMLDNARRDYQEFTQSHKDIAAALQSILERIALHVLGYYRQHTGCANLALAGGVFHNCSLNGKLLYSGLFEHVFVQPASHDAGTAYGAAIQAALSRHQPVQSSRWKHVYFGTNLGRSDEIEATLKRWRDYVEAESVRNSFDRTAELLANGAVIGWAEGRAEFGPRALGNRSILADPRPAENKDRINAMIKKREAFRPFAPAVLAERVREYFDVPGVDDEFPFMIFVLKVKQEYRTTLGAITHVDGTARVQTVSRENNPRFWELLSSFERCSKLPILLNTSFNNNAEPIVDSSDDAIGCYLTTGLDLIVLGDYLVRRKTFTIPDALFDRLVPQLSIFRRLVKRYEADHARGRTECIYSIQMTRGRYFGREETPVSESTFAALQYVNGLKSVEELIYKAQLDSGEARRVREELRCLWQDRMITLAPS